MSSAAETIALVLVDELRASGRITTVEAEALRAALQPIRPIPDREDHPGNPIDDGIRKGSGVNESAESQSAARRYLLHVLTSLDVSAARLAALARLAPTTLTRFLNSADHKFNLSTTTLEKIRDATRLPFAPFFASDDEALGITPLRPVPDRADPAKPIDDAIPLFGSQSALARACGVSQPAICKARQAPQMSARLAAAIDRATHGKISRHRSRPDIFGFPPMEHSP